MVTRWTLLPVAQTTSGIGDEAATDRRVESLAGSAGHAHLRER